MLLEYNVVTNHLAEESLTHKDEIFLLVGPGPQACQEQ